MCEHQANKSLRLDFDVRGFWRVERNGVFGGLYAGLLLPKNDSLLRKIANPGLEGTSCERFYRTAIRLQVTGGLGLLAWLRG